MARAAERWHVDGDALARRVQAGDVDAFELLYRAYECRIHALCLRLSGDPVRAVELVQDVFVRVWGHIGSYRGESAFGTWLHRLAVNVVLHDMRSVRRRLARVLYIDAGTAAEAAARPVRVEERMDLDRALTALPPRSRVAFVLHEIEGYSCEEVATMMRIAPGTVRAQLWRARQALMEALA